MILHLQYTGMRWVILVVLALDQVQIVIGASVYG